MATYMIHWTWLQHAACTASADTMGTRIVKRVLPPKCAGVGTYVADSPALRSLPTRLHEAAPVRTVESGGASARAAECALLLARATCVHAHRVGAPLRNVNPTSCCSTHPQDAMHMQCTFRYIQTPIVHSKL